MRRCVYKKIHYLTFDLELGVKVTQNVTQYPLHHVIYASTKFEVATSNGLGGDTITRNVTDGQTDGQTHGRTTDRLWYGINIPYFSYEKAGITNINTAICSCMCIHMGAIVQQSHCHNTVPVVLKCAHLDLLMQAILFYTIIPWVTFM